MNVIDTRAPVEVVVPTGQDEPAKYRLTKPSQFPRLGLLDAGSVIFYDGEPGTNLEPMNDKAKAAKVAFNEKQRGTRDGLLLRDRRFAAGQDAGEASPIGVTQVFGGEFNQSFDPAAPGRTYAPARTALQDELAPVRPTAQPDAALSMQLAEKDRVIDDQAKRVAELESLLAEKGQDPAPAKDQGVADVKAAAAPAATDWSAKSKPELLDELKTRGVSADPAMTKAALVGLLSAG